MQVATTEPQTSRGCLQLVQILSKFCQLHHCLKPDWTVEPVIFKITPRYRQRRKHSPSLVVVACCLATIEARTTYKTPLYYCVYVADFVFHRPMLIESLLSNRSIATLYDRTVDLESHILETNIGNRKIFSLRIGNWLKLSSAGSSIPNIVVTRGCYGYSRHSTTHRFVVAVQPFRTRYGSSTAVTSAEAYTTPPGCP